jgi:hypothetical protein
VAGDHPVELPAAGDREVERDPHAMERGAPRAEHAQHGGHVPGAERLVLVLRRLHRQVVAEPAGLFVGVGVATDVHEQRDVVQRLSIQLAELHQLGDAHRDAALPQHVLHRLGEPEVDPEGQRREQLGEPHRPVIGGPTHES